MKKALFILLPLIASFVSRSQVCDPLGNVVIFSNYDGGILNIDVDQNIPNLKIGICTYESVEVNITGAFVGNVTEVIYAGFDGTNNNCGSNPPTTIINGVSAGIVTMYTNTSNTIAIANYLGEPLMPGFPPLVNCMTGAEGTCDGSNSGGGNSAPQIVQFFLSEFGPGSLLHSHFLQYGCFPATNPISSGGTCCLETPVTPANPIYTGGDSYDFIPDDTVLCATSITLDVSFYQVLFQPPTYPGYVWSDGTTGPSITITSPGTYSFTVGDYCHYGGNLLTDTIVVLPCCTAPPAPILGTISDYCDGDPVAAVTATAVNGGTLTWYSDAALTVVVGTGSSYTPPSVVGSTTYYVTETNTGCEGPSSPFTIVVNALPNVTAIANPSMNLCTGDPLTLSGGGASSYVWDNGVVNGVSFLPTSNGTYTVTGTDMNGCINTASVAITVAPCEPLVAGFSYPDNICVGDCITFTDTTTGNPISWSWDFDGAATPNTSTIQNPNVCFTTTGTFNIQLTTSDAGGNTSSTTNSISVFSQPTLTVGLDSVIDIGGEVMLAANGSGLGNYLWTPSEGTVACDTCSSTYASPIITTQYIMTFSDSNSCIVQDTVFIYVNFIEGIGVPQAFSPNADGNNDILFVKGFGIEQMSFKIYNRYGQMVFETYEQSIGWDGKFKQLEQNPGVFVWVLEYTLINGSTGKISGNTTLIR